MNSNLRRVEILVWGGLLLVSLAIVGAFIRTKLDVGGPPLAVYNSISAFSLTNQNGATISADKLKGQVWIADVIFTRCPLQCVRMTKRLRELQDALPKQNPVKFVSITADPEFDQPKALKSYGLQYGADEARWYFLTGPRSEINHLAVESLKLVIYEKKPGEREVPADLFLHSTKFVLVDQQGRVRGWFDGEKPESKLAILSAVKTLLNERQP